MHRDIDHAPLLAERQRISALDLFDDGIVHAVVPEEPAAHEDPRAFVRGIVTACVSAICELTAMSHRQQCKCGSFAEPASGQQGQQQCVSGTHRG